METGLDAGLDSGLDTGRRRELEEKVRAGERLSREDGLDLYASGDLAWLGGLAHGMRARLHGDVVHFGGEDSAGEEPTAYALRYGHAGDRAGRVDRLLRLRERQDADGGLLAVAPLRHPEGPGRPVTGAEALRTFAVVRLLLDNVPHLQARPDAEGEQTAQLALQHGADDLGSPAGATNREDLLALIRDAGFTPVERDDRYGIVRRYEGPDPGRREEPQPMRL